MPRLSDKELGNIVDLSLGGTPYCDIAQELLLARKVLVQARVWHDSSNQWYCSCKGDPERPCSYAVALKAYDQGAKG